MDLDPNSLEQETPEPLESPGPESSSPEQPPEPEEASPDAEGEEGEGTEEGKEETPPAGAPAADKHKRSGGFQRKIDRLERQLEQALALAGQRGTAPQSPAAPEKPRTEAEKTAEEFHALVSRRVQEELSQREAQQEQRRQQADLQKQMAAAKAKYADFDEALADVAHIQLPSYVHEAILTSEAKAEIMYSLAKSPAELARIGALPPLLAAREIGRLEAKLASGAAPQTPKPASRPPAPPSRVVGTTASTRSLEDLPLAEYKRRMRSGGR